MTAPYFQITAAGLSAGVNAAAHGLQMSISTFKVGSAFAYSPDTAGLETGLHGTILYSGSIDNYAHQPDGSIAMICTLGAVVGPFDFGEIGIYLSDGTMLASAAFPALISKYTSLSGNVATSFSFNCYLNLGVGAANFTIMATGDAISTFATEVDLTAEIAARILGDSNEAALRAAADVTEANTRATAIAAEAVTRANADASEATTRYNADNYLQYLIATKPGLSINSVPGALYEFRGFTDVVPSGGVWAFYKISVADDGNTQDVRGGAGFVAGGTYLNYNGQGGGQGGGYGWCWRIG